LLLIVTVFYSVILSFSISERRLQKRTSGYVILGLSFSLWTFILVETVLALTRYDLSPLMLLILLFAPIVEETMKFLTIFFVGWFLQGSVAKYEMIRFGGAVGLGFSSLETFTYIARGIDLPTTIWRFVATSPLHISSCFLISTILTEKKYLLLPAAILLHSFSNYLSTLNPLLQTLLGLSVFLSLYYLSETDYDQIKEVSHMLRSTFAKHTQEQGRRSLI